MAVRVLAQIKAIVSGGFRVAYQEALPEFERTTGIKVATVIGPSQGNAPDTIPAQLRRGVPPTSCCMSREGLDELIPENRILKGSDVNLAQTPTGMAVRGGGAVAGHQHRRGVQADVAPRKVLTYYPRATSGLYVKGGVGGAFLDMDVDGFGGPAGNSSGGLGLTAGTGYDVYVGRGFWLTPGVNFSYGQADIQFNGDAVIRDWRHRQVDFTIGIKFD